MINPCLKIHRRLTKELNSSCFDKNFMNEFLVVIVDYLCERKTCNFLIFIFALSGKSLIILLGLTTLP
jgi:hypothetical protein